MAAARTFLIALRDPESAHKAMARARGLAKAGDKIILAHVERTTLFKLLGAGELRHAAPDVAPLLTTTWVSELVEAMPKDDQITIDSIVLHGDPGATIARYASKIGAAAIILAAPRAGILREFFLGSTALGILRHAPCPVLITRGEGVGKYQSAAVAIDLDPAAERVLNSALALLPKAILSLIHVYRLPNEGLLRMQGAAESVVTSLRSNMRADVEQAVAAMHELAPQSSVKLEQGFAASAILEVVRDQNPDVLVLSQHRGNLMQERRIGSVAQFLLYNCPCDLILVP